MTIPFPHIPQRVQAAARALFLLPGMTLACAVAVHCDENGDGEEVTSARVELRVYPRVTHAPAEIKVTVIVDDPDQQLICPAFVIDFGDGCRTIREESCDGLHLRRDRPTRHAPSIPFHKYRKGGEYEVTVHVVDWEVKLAATQTLRLAKGPLEW